MAEAALRLVSPAEPTPRDRLDLAQIRAHPYASSAYALALAAVGAPVDVSEWGSFVLERPIPGSSRTDAIGAYPFQVMGARADLEGGLERLRAKGLVSLVMVPDPLRGPPASALSRVFPLCRPFKTHHLVGRWAGPYDPSRHHRERIRRGQRRCRVEQVRLKDWIGPWKALYAGLVDRRAITGAAAFRPDYFDALAAEPRITAFAALVEGELAAMTLWFEHQGVVYNHLTAANAQGYANSASFALYDTALQHFSEAVVANLGGGAGLIDDPEDGLAAFKRGFANTSIPALLCGAILDAQAYHGLAAGRAAVSYFPAYRS